MSVPEPARRASDGTSRCLPLAVRAPSAGAPAHRCCEPRTPFLHARHMQRRKPRVVKGTPDVTLTRSEFDRRFRARFYDPAFAAAAVHVDALADIAWQAYIEYRKSPRTAPA